MDVPQELLEELECPMCLELFQPPLGICANGHSICDRCKTQTTTCPVCRAEFLNTRNRTLERVLEVLGEVRVRCHFHFFGCTFISSVHDITDHETICSRKPYKCPVSGCNLEIPLDRVKMHLTMKHNVPIRPQINENIKSLYRFGSCSCHKGITYREELFVHVSKMKSDRLYTCVLHIGPSTKTAKFRYVAIICRYKGQELVRADHAVRHYAEGFDHIVSLGACASFSPDVTQSLVGKKKAKLLNIEVKIYVAQD
jgi:E3 ubiquitin-protein ligase SIAH1